MENQTILNGVNVTQLVETVKAIQGNPSLAQFKFRTTTEWEGGPRTVTKAQDFFGAGTEDKSRVEPLTIISDEPPMLLGQNTGANAMELVMAAFASCLSVGIIFNAAVRGIKVDNLEFKMEGDIDLLGFLGLSETVRPGFQGIKATCLIKSDAPREDVKELFEYCRKTSAMLDILTNPVPVSLELED